MSSGSATPPAFAPRPDDDDDVRWALSTALVQWNRGGRADAVVWLRRAGEAAAASGAPARADELRGYASKLAESFWSQPPPGGSSDELEIEVDVDEGAAPPPPPPAAIRAVRNAVHSPPRPGFEAHATERQSFSRLDEARPQFSSSPEIELDEEAIDPSELEEILDYVGEDEFELVEEGPASVGRRSAEFNDRLSSAGVEPVNAESVIAYNAGLEDRSSAFERRQSTPGVQQRGAQSRPSLMDDEDFEDRATLVPDSDDPREGATDVEELALKRPRVAFDSTDDILVAGSLYQRTQYGGDTVPDDSSPESTELLDGESALAIDADLEDYRRASVDLGADWAPLDSAPPPSAPEAFPSEPPPPSLTSDLISLDSMPPSTDQPALASQAAAALEHAPDSLPPLEFPTEPPGPNSEAQAEPAYASLDSEDRVTEPISVDGDRVPDSLPAVLGGAVGARDTILPEPDSFEMDELELQPLDVDSGSGSERPLPPEAISTMPPRHTATPDYVDGTTVDGVDLADTRGFEDLPEEVQLQLAQLARVATLGEGEEVSVSGAAVITNGQVSVVLVSADEAGAYAMQSEVVFTRGTLEASPSLRIVAKAEGTRVALWEEQALGQAIEDCPWVHDELRFIADRFLAMCGATLGPLGQRLDESLRTAVFQRLEARVFTAGEHLTSEGEPLPGLFVLGGGSVELLKGEVVVEEKWPGEFLFAPEIMGGLPSPMTARASAAGALVLFASRSVAHELMISVPPLLEVLAG